MGSPLPQIMHHHLVDIINDTYLYLSCCFFNSPVIEMTIPSSVDKTVAPAGCHVVQLFTQYTPYTLSGGKQWDEQLKKQYAQTGTLL